MSSSLRKLAAFKRESLLIVASIAIAVAILEVVARALFPPAPPWLYPQLTYRAAPEVGFALIPGQHAYSGDQAVVINANGFRGAPVSVARKPGVQRLLFLGDSIGFGHGVDEPHVAAELVVDSLNRQGRPTEAVNTSVPAYNTEQEVATLRRVGLAYRPDWVIVQVCWNDVSDKSDVAVNRKGVLVSASAPQSEREAPDGFWQSSSGHDMRNAVKQFRLLYVASLGVSALRAMVSRPLELQLREDVLRGTQSELAVRGWKRVGSALHALHELAQVHQFRVLVVAFPIPLALEKPFPQSSYPANLIELARREGFPLIDLDQAFRRAYKGHTSLFIAYDGDHPNAHGHEVAAAEIARFLMEQPAVARSQSASAAYEATQE